ncbi:hypothetical protein LTR50_002616 [Elasticomyces elasticus]|nr:hypothetical protein LTR50_002616 [Elasticomyces elasticus]
MPIIERRIYLDPNLYSAQLCHTSETYAFLAALCAATIVQLDAAAQLPAALDHPVIASATLPGELFANECLRERQTFDYIEHPSTLSVMTSFFMFAYYGNNEKHDKAWHYLQESISFAQTLDLDNERAIMKLDPVESQWWRRLYWLLFVTERAYAIQRRKHTRLHASIQLPLVFESEDPHLLSGFVNLVTLFSAIDDNFVNIWRGTRRRSLCSEPWLANTQRALDTTAFAIDNVTETQQLDINVSREWLHVLAWQMGVSNGLIRGKRRDSGGTYLGLEYPVELARRVVCITSGANSAALDSHGIGMEQKLSDIAGCLTDVLRCAEGDTSNTFIQGRYYLRTLLRQLSRMRGRESRYLKPLMSKADNLIGYELPPMLSPALTEMRGPDSREQGRVFEEESDAVGQIGPWPAERGMG